MPASTYNPQALMPGWADPQQASVFDSPITSLIRAIVGGAQTVGRKTGLNDPQNQLLAIMNPMEVGPNGGLMGAIQNYIKAYHGSPHDFERFSMEKIGTGEGAQAYGHGLYFAENPETAKSYADTLGFAHRAKEPASAAGVTYPPGTARHSALMDVVDVGKEKALARLDASIRFNKEYAPDQAALQQGVRDWLAGLDPQQIQAATKGKTYEVAIHATPDQLLDWDKPLSQQPKVLQDYLAKRDPDMWHPSGSDYDPEERGQSIYRRLHEMAIRSGKAEPATIKEQQVTKSLKKAGIPGIQYLDGGSRSAGEGTRNYVIWDDKLISILKKYGLAAPVIEGLRQEAMKNNGQIDRAKLEQVMQ